MTDKLDNKSVVSKEIARVDAQNILPDSKSTLEMSSETQVTDVEFTKGDWFLCAFTAILIGGLFLFFLNSQVRQEILFLKTDEQKYAQKPNIEIAPDDDAQKLAIKVNAIQSDKHLDYLTKALLSSSARKNVGFLVGTLLALMGCIIIFRRIRQMPASVDIGALKTSLVSSSPGIIIAVMGSLIILATIFDTDVIDFKDEGLKLQMPSTANVSNNSNVNTNQANTKDLEAWMTNMNKRFEEIRRKNEESNANKNTNN